MAYKDSIKREERVAMVMSDWLHTGRLIKCVTPLTGLSPRWTHSSSCLGSTVPHQPAICVHSSLGLPHPNVLGLNYSGREKEKEKEKRHSVLFIGLFLFVCYLFSQHFQYSLTSCSDLLSSFSTL